MAYTKKRASKGKADEIRMLFDLANNWTRKQWEYTNQKGYEFSNDEQLSEDERTALEDQGMPTFTINRILPVVEMLNYYATANQPRWQAIGAEGSDTDVAAVFSDLSDYVWNNSDGNTLYANTINDTITKGVGYIMVTVDPDQDNGMGEVVLQQPDPFDLYVDPKSRDMLFRDAAFILIRKVLPKNHIAKLFPDHKAKIKKSSQRDTLNSWSARAMGREDHKLFLHNDGTDQQYGITSKGEMDDIAELFELYEKIKIAYVNVFYRVPPDKKLLAQIKDQVNVQMMELQQEMQVKLLEQKRQMDQALASGEMIQERYNLEMKKAQEMMKAQLEGAQQEAMSALMNEASKIENSIVTEKEFKILEKDEVFAENIVDTIRFHGTRIKQTCCVGDQVLYEQILPDKVVDYPIVPFHFKWTGTPFPVSAVAPLVGKQQEINKAHQIMVHNASLGSSLRWMYEEGSVDAELWEKYSAAPGALLPVRPGVERPTPVMPAPLSNAFFSIVQQGKNDMEYLAGIYSSMQGDTTQQHETFRGMLAMDEYGTRRIKQWMNTSIEPALRQLGRLVMQFSQSVYTAHKRFRIVQPNAIREQKEAEINIPVYNDMGEAIGKSMDFSGAKFDIRIVAGSTLPVNRWAYLEELKQLMQLGVVDDVAVLAETDLKNKENIIKRKSLYAQLQGQVQQLSEAVKDKDGTIETLTRQLVQAGIKGKVQSAEVEIEKQKNQVKSKQEGQYLETEAQQKLLRGMLSNNAEQTSQRMDDALANYEKDLQRKEEKA
tara:strand:+ start:167 stop:2482 length:2316 start_codon:yes stop_codon:yes gene_type:complete